MMQVQLSLTASLLSCMAKYFVHFLDSPYVFRNMNVITDNDSKNITFKIMIKQYSLKYTPYLTFASAVTLI